MAKQRASVNTSPVMFYPALEQFAATITAKFSGHVKGEPEDQLKPPTSQLFGELARITSRNLILKGESRLEGRLGKPDFAVLDGLLPIGYIELKAPGKGANPNLYTGHDHKQWERFKKVPNIIYTDGNEWALYRTGELTGTLTALSGDVTTDGKKAITSQDSTDLFSLLAEFVTWTPIVPNTPKALAAFLAPFCLLIREEVLDSLKDTASPLHTLKAEVKQLLFPDAEDFQFADAYAQTVTFALLLARMEGADALDLAKAYEKLASHHLLLSKSLQFLTDSQVLTEVSSSLSLVQRIIHEIPPRVLKSDSDGADPWLFFYEHFLAAYDPALRRESGVYYTPVEVVRCQVRLIDEILSVHLGKTMGFVEQGVATLDPAVGTGTYLLSIIDHAIRRVRQEEGPGAVKPAGRALMENLHGFEWMVGPYAVAQLRFTRAFSELGVPIPASGPGIYLTNTLESPHTKPPAPPLFHKPIAQEHERALKIKDTETVLVCLGNPPYGRHEAATEENRATTGGWVRFGDMGSPAKPILEAFLEPARQAGFGVHLKNLYNLYVYFIRWSLWKVFEHKTAKGPGILSFITASSYLDGDAFVGVREHMRRICDRIDIIDLGGEGHGARQEENVFTIKTPVAILVAWRRGPSARDIPAQVRYTRIEGSRAEKLTALDSIASSDALTWEEIRGDWQSPFLPTAKTTFSKWPNVADIFPWQQSGAQFKRLWPIAPDRETLADRWKVLVLSKSRGHLFKESRDRKISKAYPDVKDPSITLGPVEKATLSDMIDPVQYAYRSFDRQWIFPDNRLADYLRPVLWQAHSESQVYLTSLLTKALGTGPVLTVCAMVPYLDHFSNRGAKDVIPLYRDAGTTAPNIAPGLLDLLSAAYGLPVRATDIAGYVYGVLAHPEYSRRFAVDLASRKIRVPLTRDGGLFSRVSEYGQQLIWLHTYGQRLAGDDRPHGRVPEGKAKCLTPVSGSEQNYPNDYRYSENTSTLHIGDGSFAPVAPEVYDFEVSGLKVVQSWLGYRMRRRSGRKSSELDAIRPKRWTHDFTRELLELLWVLEHTVKGYPAQKELFDKVLSGPLFKASELPSVPPESRKAPKVSHPEDGQGTFFDEEE